MTRLRLAIPSKGRLKDQADAYFASAGFRLEQPGGARGYSARLDGLPGVEVMLLSASEIAAGLVAGEIHIGVTGEDLLHETAHDLEACLHLLAPLGFGRARLVVAAPRSWIDVEVMADLEDVGARMEAKTGRRLRVATKYVRSTRRFFAAKGVSSYRIVESAGATEGAPAAGAAELIVDITTTGATLEGNGLKTLKDGLILASEAQLAAALRADWSAEALASLRALLEGMDARSEGRALQSVRFSPDFDPGSLGLPLERLAPGEALCPRARVHEAARALAQSGGGPVRILETEFVYREVNDRFDRFVSRLRG
jgi:ATP phosphoribosyltransferase